MRPRILSPLAVMALLVSGLAAVTSLAPPAAAAGLTGTITFIRAHNVWVAAPDGSGQFQVTRDGTYAAPYRSPSMSDGGIIAAGYGNEVVRMKQNGTVLDRMDPPPLTNSAGQPQDGPPVDVAISPDGTKVAWTTVSYTCPIGTSCGARSVTAVTSATGLTPPTTKSYHRDPSWVTGSRLMVHGGYLSQMMLQDLGGAAQHWFDDEDTGMAGSTDLGDATLNRSGTGLVAVRGYGTDTHLITYGVSGNPLTGAVGSLPTPAPLCVTGTDENLASPTFGPDGMAFALAETGGITVVTSVAANCAMTALDTVLKGGSEPHWSPAALNTTADPGGPGDGSGGDGSGAVLEVVKRPVVKGKARVGARLRATAGTWSRTPSKVRYTWLRNGKAIKVGTKKATTRTYRITRKDRGRKIQVKVTVWSGKAKASARSKAVRIRR